MNVADQIAKNQMALSGLKIVSVFKALGYEACIVGGCVRDIILGLAPKAIDIATNAPMEIIERAFECHDIGKSKDFGIVVARVDNFDFEIAQFRTDGEYSDGRHPDGVLIADSFQEDCKRRDFTINALGIDMFGHVIDHVHGIEDIEAGIIRTVGDPVERFNEDHLRMLRAVRFSARLGFKIEDSTFAAIRTLRQNVDLVAKERVKDELFKMASCDGVKFAETIKLLDRCRLLEVILPEVKQLQEVQEEPRFHPEAYLEGDGTSFDHTLAAVRQNVWADSLVNLAVLFHDLGKGVTHELDKGRYPEYRHRFHNHDVKGGHIAGEVADRLTFSGDEKEVVVFCARSHMSIFHCKKMKKSTAAKYATHELFPYLKQVMYCDDSCRIGKFNSEKFLETIKLVEQIGRDFKGFKTNNKVKLVDGRVVMELTGMKPSPKLGEVIDTVTERFLDSETFVCLRKLIKDVANEVR